MPNRVYLFDTTLRDGEQSPGCSMTVPEKLRLARKLVELGVDILEAGFPIASDGDFEAVDAVSREFPWAQVAALARANTPDIERAAAALKHAKRPRIHTFIATSDIHLKYKLKKSRQQVLDEAVAAVELAREHTDDVEFSAEDATRTDWDYLEQISPRRGRRRSPHGEPSGHRRLLHPRRICRVDRPHGARARAIAPSSACIVTTIWDWLSPIPSPRSRPARVRSNAPSTASASGPATRRSKRS